MARTVRHFVRLIGMSLLLVALALAVYGVLYVVAYGALPPL